MEHPTWSISCLIIKSAYNLLDGFATVLKAYFSGEGAHAKGVPEMSNHSDVFCALPWVHLNINPDGAATLCCQSHHPLREENGKPLNLQTHSLEEIWNSSALRGIRADMVAGKPVPHCFACHHNEKIGAGSYRLVANQRWQATVDADLCEGGQTRPPRYFDLRVGNLCNLKCVICKSLYSSQIERDPVHGPWTEASYQRLEHRFEGSDDWDQAPEILDEIVAISRNVEEIQLAGGEPTINKTMIGWLNHLCETGKAAQIHLGLVTNFINVNPRIYNLLPAFKSVDLKLSIDGYGGVYDYVRYPGKWDYLIRNVEKAKSTRSDIQFYVMPVLNVYNFLHIFDLLEWSDKQGFHCHATLARGVNYIDSRLLPPVTRRRIHDRLEDYVSAGRAAGLDGAGLRGRLAPWLAEIDATDFNPETRARHIDSFMKFTNDLDRSRSLNFRERFPMLYQDIVAYYGPWRAEGRFYDGRRA